MLFVIYGLSAAGGVGSSLCPLISLGSMNWGSGIGAASPIAAHEVSMVMTSMVKCIVADV